MITQATSAGNTKARVVLQLGCGRPSAAALDAAFRFARAFGSEVESIFVEDRKLIDSAVFPFANEVSFSGRQRRPVEPRSMQRDLKLSAAAAQRHIEKLAQRAKVKMRFDIVRDDPVHAVAAACLSGSHRHMVTLAEPMRAENFDLIERFFAAIPGSADLVVVGAKARVRRGPTVVVTEEIEHLPAMLQTAERLSVPGEEVILLLLGETEEHLTQLEEGLRLALGGELAKLRLAIAEKTHGEPQVAAETLRRLRGGLVIGRHGSRFMAPLEGRPGRSGLRVLTGSLECPLVLVN